jgi:phage-related baseplate assembly protein
MSLPSIIDLSALPVPDMIETVSFEDIVQNMRDDLVARFPAIVGVVDLESEPARKLIEVFAYREITYRARINDACRSLLIGYSTASDLDNLGAFYDVVRLTDETDARFRERIVLAIMGRSPGGTEARYRYIAMSASEKVRSVAIWRDEIDPTVRVSVLATNNGGIPTAGVLDAVTDALNDPTIKLVSDTITVESAVLETKNVTANIWLLPTTPMSVFNGLETSLKAAWEAEGGLGFDMTKAWLTARLMQAGVQKVDIVTPASDQVAPFNRAISMGNVNLTMMGRNT